MRLVGWVVLGMMALVGCTGEAGVDGQDGTSCTVVGGEDGAATLTCEDGTSVVIRDGQNGRDGLNGEDGQNGADGTDGWSCSVTEHGDGTKTIACEDGTSVTLGDGQDGADGKSCTVTNDGGGRFTLACEDGTQVSWTVPPSACVVAFDDAYDAHVSDLDAFYGASGIHFENGAGMGVIGGVGNGDPGNWNIEGTNGSAAWGLWVGPHAISFGAPVGAFGMDFLRGYQDVSDMRVTASLAGEVIATRTVTLSGPMSIASVSFEGLEVDRISWDNPITLGVDNITYLGHGCP